VRTPTPTPRPAPRAPLLLAPSLRALAPRRSPWARAQVEEVRAGEDSCGPPAAPRPGRELRWCELSGAFVSIHPFAPPDVDGAAAAAPALFGLVGNGGTFVETLAPARHHPTPYGFLVALAPPRHPTPGPAPHSRGVPSPGLAVNTYRFFAKDAAARSRSDFAGVLCSCSCTCAVFLFVHVCYVFVRAHAACSCVCLPTVTCVGPDARARAAPAGGSTASASARCLRPLWGCCAPTRRRAAAPATPEPRGANRHC